MQVGSTGSPPLTNAGGVGRNATLESTWVLKWKLKSLVASAVIMWMWSMCVTGHGMCCMWYTEAVQVGVGIRRRRVSRQSQLLQHGLVASQGARRRGACKPLSGVRSYLFIIFVTFLLSSLVLRISQIFNFLFVLFVFILYLLFVFCFMPWAL